MYIPKQSPLVSDHPILIVQGEDDHYAKRFNELSNEAFIAGGVMNPSSILFTMMIELYNEVMGQKYRDVNKPKEAPL